MKAALAIIATLLLGTCSQPPTVLEQIMRAGELRVVTRNLPSAYYLGASGPQGPEFELASRFAAELGVRLFIYSVPNVGDVMRELESHRAHIAAAGLTRGMKLPSQTSFGPPYQQVREHLIFRQGSVRARNLAQAVNSHIEVVTGSAHAATLEQARLAVPNLSWVENPSAETEELLYRLSRREFDYTVADSNEFAIGRAFHPDIRIAFDISAGKALAWAVDARDPSLLRRVTAFYASLKAEGRLASILDTYYGDVDRFDYIQARVFIDDIQERLPQYRHWFKEAASQVGVDWRLLAAIGYQESHWVPTATSPTGVRGLMMLTEETARGLNIADRLDPRDSIFGGAQYFLRVRNQIPSRILEPDRTWMTLAAYNVGLGHLEDARILTQMHGKNPDSWDDVREHLPLLTQTKWYTQVKRGYARGWEPVRFVENIRSYMDILDWVAADAGPPAQREAAAK
ncbi:MAG TPA: membrane-bound lytic murein transglycosylase MltF [Povalibacter sp.]|nr:membrane-bound lytic murein transglycosylase MltF [Povalibacter sp.]